MRAMKGLAGSPPEAMMGHRPARHGLLHLGCALSLLLGLGLGLVRVRVRVRVEATMRDMDEDNNGVIGFQEVG